MDTSFWMTEFLSSGLNFFALLFLSKLVFKVVRERRQLASLSKIGIPASTQFCLILYRKQAVSSPPQLPLIPNRHMAFLSISRQDMLAMPRKREKSPSRWPQRIWRTSAWDARLLMGALVSGSSPSHSMSLSGISFFSLRWDFFTQKKYRYYPINI